MNSDKAIISKPTWQFREREADLNIKYCYVWVARYPEEKAVLIEGQDSFQARWSQVRQVARSAKDGATSNEEYSQLYEKVFNSTYVKLSQIPPEVDAIARYAIAYKWAEKPKNYPRLSETDFTPYQNDPRGFIEKLIKLEILAAEKIASGKSNL